MRQRVIGCLALLAALTGCQSNLRPLLPLQHQQVWVPDTPSTTVAVAPPTTTPATQAATQPGHIVTMTLDPNQTTRFIYKAGYDNIWQQAILLFHKAGFDLDRQDYRDGVLTTEWLPSAQIVEFWKPQQTNPVDSAENTFHSQRRWGRLTISKVPGKPDFYEIAVQVLVERQSNPSEQLYGPIFVAGSGFGRNGLTLQSDFAPPKPEPDRWVIIGHDPDLEVRLLNDLFLHL